MPKEDGDLLRKRGTFLKERRESLKSRTNSIKRRDANMGTQKWLADECQISVRTINNLERGEKVSEETVKAVCLALDVNYRRISLEQYSSISPSIGKIDFRSQKHLNEIKGDIDKLKQCRLMITLDPFELSFFDDDFARLEGVNLSLPREETPFSAVRVVKLVEGGNGWLGYEDDFGPNYDIDAECSFKKSIMLSQSAVDPMSWGKFLSMLNDPASAYLDLRIDLTLNDVEYNNNKFRVSFLLRVNMYELKHHLDGFLKINKNTLPCRMHGDGFILRESLETTMI